MNIITKDQKLWNTKKSNYFDHFRKKSLIQKVLNKIRMMIIKK